jgi:N-acetylmuramic acid 6-phosphate etherase
VRSESLAARVFDGRYREGMADSTGSARDGLRRSLASFSTELVNDASRDLDVLGTRQQVLVMCEDNASVPAVVAAESASIARAIDGVVERLRRRGRLVYVGAGTPGRLGVLDASEIPPTYGTDPSTVIGLIAGGPDALRRAVENAEDDAAAGEREIADLGIGADDAVVGISASGRTPYVLGAVREARARGAFTVGFACNPESDLGAAAHVAIETVVGPEIVTGSTRLKAGTAQKLVLNMISTLSMVQLGKVYGNLMVDMKATNEKLRARAERTVMLATGTDAATAAAALAEVDGSVKAAILVVISGLDGAAAVRALAEHGGMLRAAIADRPPASGAADPARSEGPVGDSP